MLLKGKNYPLALDYLLCKSLLEVSNYINEKHMMECFYNKSACQTEEELSICMMRNFLLQHRFTTEARVVNSYFKYRKIKYQFNGFVGNLLEEKNYNLIQCIQEKEGKEIIIKYLLVVAYIEENKEIILPISKEISKLLTSNSIAEVRKSISNLVRETKRIDLENRKREG